MKPLFFDPAKIPVPAPVHTNSASQIKNYEQCERLWTLQNPHKLRAPDVPGSPLSIGTALHKQIEEAVLYGREPPSPLAYAGWKNLPAKGSGLALVEKQLTKKGPPDKDGKPTQVLALHVGIVPFKGSIDYVWQPFGETKFLDIWDHKSTTNLSWAKSSLELKTDLQLHVYAYYVFQMNESLEYVNVHHNYLVTSSFNTTQVVSAVITRAENAAFWKSRIEARAQEMQIIADMALQSGDADFWKRAKPNKDACSAFGGCAFRKLCYSYDLKEDETEQSINDAFFEEVLASVVTHTLENKMSGSASDLLAKRVGAVKTAIDSTPAAVKAAPASAPAAPANPMLEMMARRAAQAQVPVTHIAKPAAPAQAAPAVSAKAPAVSAPATAVSILPPDAPAQGPGIDAPAKMAPIDPDDLTAEGEPETAAQTEEKAKRKRRTKAEMEAARAAEAAQTPVAGIVAGVVTGRLSHAEAATALSALPRAAPAAGTPAATERLVENATVDLGKPGLITLDQGFTLCIGCMPVMTGSPSVSLEFIVGNLLDAAAKQMNIANVHVLDYSKKASLITELLKKYEFTASCYTFTTNDNFLEGIIMQTVAQKATTVIRGVR